MWIPVDARETLAQTGKDVPNGIILSCSLQLRDLEVLCVFVYVKKITGKYHPTLRGMAKTAGVALGMSHIIELPKDIPCATVLDCHPGKQ